MGGSFSKLLKSRSLDVTPVVDPVHPTPVDLAKLKKKEAERHQRRSTSTKRKIPSISEDIQVRPLRDVSSIPQIKRHATHAKEQASLPRSPKLGEEPKRLPDLIVSSTDTSDSELSNLEVEKLPLSPTEKQRLAETKFDKTSRLSMSPVPDAAELPQSPMETQIMDNSNIHSKTVYKTFRPPDAKFTKTEDHETRSQTQSPVSIHAMTTSLTDYDKGNDIASVDVAEKVPVLQLNPTQIKETDREKYVKQAQTQEKTEEESINIPKSAGHDSSLPKELQGSGFDVCSYLIKLKSSQEDFGPFMNWFCSLAKKSIESADRVWLGYELEKPNKPVVVAIYKGSIPELPKRFNNFEIIKRNEKEISEEGIHIAHAEQIRDMKFSSKEQQRVQQCLTNHSPSLMKSHSNLNIVSASKLKCKHYGTKKVKYTGQTCITLYVQIKGVIPFFEEPFPKELGRFPVDVREGTFHTFGKNPDDIHPNLMMGCQIVSAYNKAGTLGGFVQLQNGNIGCLTCCHLFQTMQSIQDYQKDPLRLSYFNKDVFQPSPAPDFKFGNVAHFFKKEGDHENIGVDMALIEITNPLRYPTTGGFPNAELPEAGFSPENPMEYTSGEIVKGFDEIPPMPCSVVKYGISTGHTVGMLHLSGSAVYKHSTSFFPNDYIRLHRQFEVYSIKDKPFALEGDSGALVFLISQDKKEVKIRALGLLVGGTDYGTTIVTPIWAILEQLELPLRLLSFGGLKETYFSKDENDRLQRIEKDVDSLKAGVSTLYSRLEETTQTTQRTEQNIGLMDRKIEEIRTSVANKQDIEMILQLLSKK